jgi:pilus assembly protein CpaF
MSDIDRIVSSLIRSDVPLDRNRLTEHGNRIIDDIAPLARPDAVDHAVDTIVGLGPLEGLLDDDDVTDVLVNGPHEVWIERHGTLELSDVRFRDDDDVVAMIRRVLAPLGRRIDRAEPGVDARLADGSRLHALIPPASVDGPIVAIRRFHPAVVTLDDLQARGSIEERVADELRAAVAEGMNILVTGPTGAGKTTLLNVLCAEIPSSARIVTIEDAAELRVSGHVVRLESRRANVEGMGDITMRQLVRHALRLRPDRIIVGEVRGAEALDMLQALNTGHRGSMSTIHANGAAEALVRLESLAAMASEDVPHHALGSLARSAIDAVVVVGRVGADRRVTGFHRIEDLKGDVA